MGAHMKRAIKFYEIDREFLAHMEELDRKKARAYQRDIALEDEDNYSNIMINKEIKRGRNR